MNAIAIWRTLPSSANSLNSRSRSFKRFVTTPPPLIEPDWVIAKLGDPQEVREGAHRVPRVVSMEPVVARFPPQRASVAAARQFVTDTLVAAGVTSVLDEARLLVSELATNAVVHAATDFSVSVHLAAGRVYVEVRDGDTIGRADQRPTSTTLPLGGQGLRIVGRLAGSWGSRVEDHSKVVW